MWNDPIIEELHQTRAEISHECHSNLHEISLMATKIAQMRLTPIPSGLTGMTTPQAPSTDVASTRG
jgi:hypothetical protein